MLGSNGEAGKEHSACRAPHTIQARATNSALGSPSASALRASERLLTRLWNDGVMKPLNINFTTEVHATSASEATSVQLRRGDVRSSNWEMVGDAALKEM